MARYTYAIEDDDPFELVCAPKYEGQQLDVLETEADDPDVVHRRFIGCKASDGTLYWEAVPRNTYPCPTKTRTVPKLKRKR